MWSLRWLWSLHFNPRPPWGGRPRARKQKSIFIYFNPRPPWGGRLLVNLLCQSAFQHFNPRPPWGGRRADRRGSCRRKKFQSTPSVGRATVVVVKSQGGIEFQSTPSVGRATRNMSIESIAEEIFQSTPSVGRATRTFSQTSAMLKYFNPRPPWGGRPVPRCFNRRGI